MFTVSRLSKIILFTENIEYASCCKWKRLLPDANSKHFKAATLTILNKIKENTLKMKGNNRKYQKINRKCEKKLNRNYHWKINFTKWLNNRIDARIIRELKSRAKELFKEEREKAGRKEDWGSVRKY